jgi:flagellar assembly protein FliH
MNQPMGQARKFLFDVSFDQPDPPEGAARPAEPVFSQADLDTARSEGTALGRSTALAEAAVTTEARIAASFQSLQHGIEQLNAAHDQMCRATEQAAIELMREVLRRAVPALCRKEAFSELEALVTRCFSEAFTEPRLVLRVHDALFDAMQSRIGPLTQTTGFTGKVVLLADETLSLEGGRIEWADGGAERDPLRLMSEIDAALARTLAAPAETRRPLEENTHG